MGTIDPKYLTKDEQDQAGVTPEMMAKTEEVDQIPEPTIEPSAESELPEISTENGLPDAE